MEQSQQSIAGIDIGGTNVRFAIARPDSPTEFLAHHVIDTPTGLDPEAFADRLAREVRTSMSRCRVDGDSLSALGCDTPGIVDADSGIVRAASNLGWAEVPLAELLAERLGVPVAVENDVKAAALAEYRYGAGRRCSPLVYVTVSTGVSAGIVIDGRVHRGRHHAAGELAFFVPDPAHLDQDWSPNGCLETTSAGVGLARAWASNGRTGTAADVFTAAHQGDPDARALVQRAADYLALTAVAIGTILDPEVIVLGGSIARNEPTIIHRIKEVTGATLPFPFEIRLAALGGDAPIVGALALATDRAHEGRQASKGGASGSAPYPKSINLA